jgi:hypothetical protein
MGVDGSIVSVENSPETDQVEVTVLYSGHRHFLGFLTASSWFDVEPRDRLAELVLTELREPQGEAWFPLGGLAEDSEMRRTHDER